MEIEGVKVPETIEELNALGLWLKIIEEDVSKTIDAIKEYRGQDVMDDWVDLYSDFNCNRIRDAYNAGAVLLLKKAIADVTDRLTRDKMLDGNIYWALRDACEQEREKFYPVKRLPPELDLTKELVF